MNNSGFQSASGKVLIAAPVHPVLIDGLTSLGYVCQMHEKISQATAYDLIKGCVGVVTSTRLQLDKALIDAAPQLQWIGRMGSGMEVIDVPYCNSKGIVCFGSPEGNSNAVGEHALGMLLALIRKIVWSNIEMKEGIWLREENRGTELEGKTIGIIGCGHTGSAFAKKLRGFDTRLLAYDKYNCDGIPTHMVACKSLDQIFEEADIVSFHVPLQEDTKNYFDEHFLEQMHKPFILINTSRGPVVNTIALMKGLAERKVTGACLDVFEQEPFNTFGPGVAEGLISLPYVVVTPHIAGYTFEALYKMSRVLLNKIEVMRTP